MKVYFCETGRMKNQKKCLFRIFTECIPIWKYNQTFPGLQIVRKTLYPIWYRKTGSDSGLSASQSSSSSVCVFAITHRRKDIFIKCERRRDVPFTTQRIACQAPEAGFADQPVLAAVVIANESRVVNSFVLQHILVLECNSDAPRPIKIHCGDWRFLSEVKIWDPVDVFRTLLGHGKALLITHRAPACRELGNLVRIS